MKKSQEQIIFENLYYKHKGGWWRNNPPQSLGNIIHWLYVYGTLHIAEQVTVGDRVVHLFGELFCRFLFEDDSDVPYFYDFKDEEKYDFIKSNQKYYLDGLKKFTKFVKEVDQKYDEVSKIMNEKK